MDLFLQRIVFQVKLIAESFSPCCADWGQSREVRKYIFLLSAFVSSNTFWEKETAGELKIVAKAASSLELADKAPCMSLVQY